jgi:hypothetical protein
VLGIAVRLMIGVFLRATADSVLAVGILHQVFDASNNRGALVDSLLDGVDATVVAEIGAVILTVAVAAVLWLRRGRRVYARRQVVPATSGL